MTAINYQSNYQYYGGIYKGAGQSRLLADWNVWLTDPKLDYQQEAGVLAARAWDLVKNDPLAAAIVDTLIMGTHGAKGLRFRSLYQDDSNPGTSPEERTIRAEIEAAIEAAGYGVDLDAGGMLTRYDIEVALDTVAIVSGDCFAVRVWRPGRAAAGATCWRIVRPERVGNPDARPDDDTIFQGIEFDADKRPKGIWVDISKTLPWTGYADREYQFIPWYGDDGTPNVIHRRAKIIPGVPRSVSLFAPLLINMKQLAGLCEAYVVAKRAQATHPIIVKTDDPANAAKSDRKGAILGPHTSLAPGKVYYTARENDVIFSTWQFNGQDMREFLDTGYRSLCAAVGLPFQVVLAQLTDANLAAARAAMLQYYRTCERRQDEHINQVTGIMDRCMVAEAIARGECGAHGTWPQILRGRYIRPARAMPDPLKEAEAAKAWIELGMSYTSAFSEIGRDHDDEVLQSEEDMHFRNEHGVGDSPTPESVRLRDAQFIERVAAAQAGISKSGADIPWPAVIGAQAAATAPGAYIEAVIGAVSGGDGSEPDGDEANGASPSSTESDGSSQGPQPAKDPKDPAQANNSEKMEQTT